MKTPLWLNGRLQSEEEARIAPSDRGFLLGDGLFETMRVQGGTAPLLERHLQRLEDGAALLELPPPGRQTVRDAVRCLLEAAALEAGSLRLTLTRGSGPRGLLPPEKSEPTLLLTVAPGISAPGSASRAVRLHLGTQIRDARSILSRVKSLNYLPGILAQLEAARHNADDALLLSAEGYVSEASAATLLVLKGDTLLTPPLEDGPLPGISRARLLESGSCREERIHPDELTGFEAAWLVTSLALRPVRSLDGRRMRQNDDWTARLERALF